MEILTTVITGILTLAALVVVHEFGHYWVARRCGVQILRFSVGFGKPIFTRVNSLGTEFTLAPVFLGGYVKMAGMDEPGDDESEDSPTIELKPEGSFNNKSLAQRMAIVSAGPAINILLALLVYWGLFMVGSERPAAIIAEVVPSSPAADAGLQAGDRILQVDGEAVNSWQEIMLALAFHAGETVEVELAVENKITDDRRRLFLQLTNWLNDESAGLLAPLGLVPRELYLPVIAEVLPDSPAARAGLLPGDRIISSGEKRFWGWQGLTEFIRERPGITFSVLVARGSERLTLELTPDTIRVNDAETGRLGVSADLTAIDREVAVTERYNPFAALIIAAEHLWKLTVFSLSALGKMIVGVLSPEQLSGPIAIVKLTGEAASAGWQSYLNLVALISLSLGILNLLPIPVLDGGHLLYLSAEGVRGRPLPLSVQLAGQYIGLAIIGLLMIFVIYNDLARL